MRLESLVRPGVYSVPADVTLQEAAIEMRRLDIGSLAVLDDGRLEGIITERDLVRAIADGLDPRMAPVARYMSGDPLVADPRDGAEEVAARMVTLGVRHLPVLLDGDVVGMVSIRDIVEATSLPEG